tara:strand:- start:231 stop:1268 length:1038 start_codon:yes stop_codon:yes gene_type:complete
MYYLGMARGLAGIGDPYHHPGRGSVNAVQSALTGVFGYGDDDLVDLAKRAFGLERGHLDPWSDQDPDPVSYGYGRQQFALVDDRSRQVYWIQTFAEIEANADEGVDPGLGLVKAARTVMRGGPETTVNLGAGFLLMDASHPDVTQDNPCGAGGYGPGAGLEELEAAAAANPVKGDGRWHRSTLGEANTHQMRTQKGVAICFPYRPRKFPTPSRALEDLYQREHGRKLPAGTKWLSWIRPGWPDRRRPSAPMAVTAHKTLDEAKRAGETALRKLPMPSARSNPAALINAGILAGSTPIPSGIDSTPVSGGILAGSRPIPSGFRDPRVNVGLVDPPLTRRSKPEQPF